MSLSARRAWIEISVTRYRPKPKPSLSARRAWIEIASCRRISGRALVALRKESVDRNMLYLLFRPVVGVALRKESVDRNTNFCPASLFDLPSLSARRAWIEIFRPSPQVKPVRGRSPQGERG